MAKISLRKLQPMHFHEINQAIGHLDIYLLDQILKGRFEDRPRILDAGSGEGRNLKYFVDNGYEVFANDLNTTALTMLRMAYKRIPKDHIVSCDIEELPFQDNYFDAIICMAVLHFARDEAHFKVMLKKLHDGLKHRGLLFIRMATDVGTEKTSEFPFTLKKKSIDATFQAAGLQLVEPWKSVVVAGKRSMGSFVLSKT